MESLLKTIYYILDPKAISFIDCITPSQIYLINPNEYNLIIKILKDDTKIQALLNRNHEKPSIRILCNLLIQNRLKKFNWKI